jgi:hypothetical protein
MKVWIAGKWNEGLARYRREDSIELAGELSEV